MFDIFKKPKRLSPVEEFENVLLVIFSTIRDACGMTGIERDMQVIRSFGIGIPYIRKAGPSVRIEPDGPAMIIMSVADDDPDWSVVDREIEHVIDQVRRCPDDRDRKIMLMYYFLAPKYFSEKLARHALK